MKQILFFLSFIFSVFLTHAAEPRYDTEALKYLLHDACKNLHTKLVRVLLGNGKVDFQHIDINTEVDFNATDRDGNSPLMNVLLYNTFKHNSPLTAKQNDNVDDDLKILEIVKELIFKGASIKIKNKRGETFESLVTNLNPGLQNSINELLNEYNELYSKDIKIKIVAEPFVFSEFLESKATL